MKLTPRISWRSRKRYLYAVTAFAMAMAGYVVWFMADDSRVSETVIVAAFALLGACVGSYVFGAVWQDTSINREAEERSRPSPRRRRRDEDEDEPDYDGRH